MAELKPHQMSWGWHFAVSISVGVLALIVGFFWRENAIELLLVLFGWGVLAGRLSGRHGWLSGIIVGLPAGLYHLGSWAAAEVAGGWGGLAGAPDFWILAVPAAAISTGMSIMGGIVGAWLKDVRWQRS